MRVTAVIVYDHAGFGAMARRLLPEPGFDVVGEAVDGAGVLPLVVELRPGLVLLHVQLPDIDGFTIAAELARTIPKSVVVLTSVRGSSDYAAKRIASSPARLFIPEAEFSGDALVAVLDATA